jgi:hypothetical protein
MISRQKMQERYSVNYSIQEDSGDYRALWLSDKPKYPSDCFRWFIGIENMSTQKIRVILVKRFYFGKDNPYFCLQQMGFDDTGLIAEIQEISDIEDNRNPIHPSLNLRFRYKTMNIPRRKFPN